MVFCLKAKQTNKNTKYFLMLHAPEKKMSDEFSLKWGQHFNIPFSVCVFFYLALFFKVFLILVLISLD